MAFDPREGGEFEGCDECPACGGGPLVERYAAGDVDCNKVVGTECASCAARDCEICGEVSDDINAAGACGRCAEASDVAEAADVVECSGCAQHAGRAA